MARSSVKKARFTGTSGAMFLASRLAYEQQVYVEVTRDNTPWIDMLVSSEDGTSAVGIQVKSTEEAIRRRYYEWNVGEKLMTTADPNLLVALVDLKKWTETPDYYLVTAADIQRYYRNWQKEFPDKVIKNFWMYRPTHEEVAAIRNDARPLLERLTQTNPDGEG